MRKHWRINLILVFIFIFGAAIISRLVFLQILNRGFYRALAQGQQKIIEEVSGTRGEIFLQPELQKLATNKNWESVYISPREINKKVQDPSEITGPLSEILDIDQESIFEKIEKDNFYALIKNKLTEKELEDLKELNLPGVYLQQALFRYYPQGDLASQIVGFVGGNGQGQYGIEGYYNEILEGEEGFIQAEKGPLGYLTLPGSSEKFSVQKGSDLILTLDYNIQFMAEKMLNRAKEKMDIEGGQIIILDPNSGKIIALANFPNFNPGQYSEVQDLEIFQNGAIQKIFEPGSIFKPITMAAALEEQKITPYTTYIDQGFVKIGGYTIYNYEKTVWGEQTMIQVLENSINTGAVFVESQIPHHIFLDYIKRFGMFEPTGIDLQGEVFSENKEFKKGYEINFATASFGQGIEMTPLQIARAISCIANGGKLVKPYMVEKIITDGKIIETQPEILSDSVISSRTASKLTAMLVSSVENGYAKRAKIPGYYIAGKTGTSQIPFSSLGIDKSGYSDKTWQAFIGWFPAFSPRFLILVKLNNPKAKAAGISTTLIARDLMKYIINYYQIPPDYEE